MNPILAFSPGAISRYLLTGGSGSAPLYLTNLLGTSQMVTLGFTTSVSTSTYTGTRSGSGGPAYNWIELSGSGGGTILYSNYTDDITTTVPTGLNMPFYGGTFSTINVCSNGWASFTDSHTYYANVSLPATNSSGAPVNAVFPLWDDLLLNASGQNVLYKQTVPGSEFVIEWNNVSTYSGTGTYTFEVILHSNGEILFEYKSASGQTNYVIGVQNADGTQAVQMAFRPSTPYVSASSAIQILPPSTWASLSATSVTLAAWETKAVNVNFNAGPLSSGSYSGAITIIAGGQNAQTVGFTLNVGSSPPAAPVISSTLAFTGTVGVPFSYQITASNSPASFYAAGLPAGLYVDPAAGTISGIPTASGTSSVTLTANNAGGPGTATLVIAIPSLPPVGQWRYQYWGSPLNSGPAAESADPNGDGVSNLAAYAFGLSPFVNAAASLPAASVSSGYLALTFTRAKTATDITYHVLAGPDPRSLGEIWNSASYPYSGGNAATQQVTVPDTMPINGAASRFMRLQITRP